jgi:O-acetylserine/cysteine efflux transporter
MGLKAIDYGMGVTVALVWGMGFVFAKAAIGHFPPILLMSLRFAVTALALVWFVRMPAGMLARIFGIAIVGAAIQYSLTFTGLKGLDASVAALVVQLEVPFLVLLGAVLLKETPGLRKWLGIVLAFGGVALIAGEPRVGGAWASLLLVVGGAFAWALGQAMVRSLRNIDGLTVTAWTAVFACPQLFVMSLVFETGHLGAIASAGWLVWSAVVYLGLVMTAFGYGLWNTLVRRHPISTIAPFLLLMPVFSAVGAMAFLGETLTARLLLGGAIVIAGVGFILIERPLRSPAPSREAAAEERRT